MLLCIPPAVFDVDMDQLAFQKLNKVYATQKFSKLITKNNNHFTHLHQDRSH